MTAREDPLWNCWKLFFLKNQPFKVLEIVLRANSQWRNSFSKKSMKIWLEREEYVLFEPRPWPPFPLWAQQGRTPTPDYCIWEPRGPSPKAPSWGDFFPKITRLQYFLACPQLLLLSLNSRWVQLRRESPLFHPVPSHGKEALPWPGHARNIGALNGLDSSHEATIAPKEKQAKSSSGCCPYPECSASRVKLSLRSLPLSSSPVPGLWLIGISWGGKQAIKQLKMFSQRNRLPLQQSMEEFKQGLLSRQWRSQRKANRGKFLVLINI